MKKMLVLSLGLLMCSLSFGAEIRAAEENTIKQPVFLLCPHKERYSAWSLSLVVEKGNPSKPVKMVLEKLSGKNGKDDGYAKVLDAQRDPKTEREALASLDAASFSGGSLRVEQDNALTVTVAPDGENLKLNIDMRISAKGHFILGGNESDKRNVVLKYNKALKIWDAYATVLEDKDGTNAVTGEPLLITGLAFPVTGTGIYRIGAVLAGGSVVLVYDK